MSKTYKGSISVSSRGVGYFSHPDFKEDVEIQPENINTAMHNDEVEIVIVPAPTTLLQETGKMPRVQGKVIKIIKRAKIQFIGTLNAYKDFFFLKPDDRRLYKDIFIHSSKAMGAKDGDKVQAQIVDWKDPSKGPEGKVIKILGKKGVHEVEMQSIILEKGFELDFPQEVEKDAHKILDDSKKDFDEEIKNRKDFRNVLTFTIDPSDAKDFDDALSFQKVSDELFQVGVHIADVSHFVKTAGIIDKEARRRGTSVYLVDRTIPMLPEILSNDLCSLKPDEDKLTFSAVFVINKNAEVKERWFGKTIIHSDKRFTYENAQEIIDSKNGEYFEELSTLNDIAKILTRKKLESGAIDFETDEVRFELDKDGKPLRVYRKERLDTHKLIEEFMLLANKEVAKFMTPEKKSVQNGAFVYRIHDLPDKEKIMNLSIFIKALGYELHSENGEVTAKDINNLLKQVDGKPEESLIKTAAVRAMAKAVYSTRNIGHFGLGFRYYTHFTSPIRRYPDLVVHRLLLRFLTKGKIEQGEMIKYEKLMEDCTDKEISAADAERTSVKYKQVEYMLSHIGKEFDATVSGVSEWGVYIEEIETKAEGMVRFKNMTDDMYNLDEKNYAVVGMKTKKKYSLGDKVRVKLTDADLDRRTLDFIFV
ncbi:MAG TPA: ribonuclease R [Candidatus Paceibacterota bacterium]